MTEIVYRGDWPDDVRKIVGFCLKPYLCLIPGWCRTIDVRFESHSEGKFSADIRVSYENRWAVLTICPQWLEDTPSDRERVLAHEIIHILVQPMKTVFMDAIDGLDETFKKFAWERFKEAWEGATEDLAWAFHSITEREK